MKRRSDRALLCEAKDFRSSRAGAMDEMVPKSTFRADCMTVKIFETRRAMGAAAAHAAALTMSRLTAGHKALSVIFATGDSQLETLHALCRLPDITWKNITGFHMDEYIGLAEDHPASFRRYLRENLIRRVPFERFHEIDGRGNPGQTCAEYANLLRSHAPSLCLLGIGENGHLAFNDPAEADFHDPKDVKVVSLDKVCRQQQVNEGWFAKLEDVPERAITLTIPALFRVPELILSVPGARKAAIVKRALYGPISTDCPASVLRRHSNATVFLDAESAAQLEL